MLLNPIKKMIKENIFKIVFLHLVIEHRDLLCAIQRMR